MQRASGGVLNSTCAGRDNSYSWDMSQNPIETTVIHQPLENRWATWQARGVANDRATRRNLFIVAGILIFATIILNVLPLVR